MRLDNGTSDPVDYEQTGGGPGGGEGEDQVKGTLGPKGSPDSSAEFPPTGMPPFMVVFTYPPDTKPIEKEAIARDIPRAVSTVRLCPDWTTAVDRKCGSS